MNRWTLATIKATLEDEVKSDELYTQDIVEAKLEIQREIENDNSGVLVESIKAPSFFKILKCYFTL
jgi:hypothetical protein